VAASRDITVSMVWISTHSVRRRSKSVSESRPAKPSLAIFSPPLDRVALLKMSDLGKAASAPLASDRALQPVSRSNKNYCTALKKTPCYCRL
jgi:hypothetical protein